MFLRQHNLNHFLSGLFFIVLVAITVLWPATSVVRADDEVNNTQSGGTPAPAAEPPAADPVAPAALAGPRPTTENEGVDDKNKEISLLSRALWWLAKSLFGTLASWAGGLLDYMIFNITLDFGDLYKNYFGFAVDQLWGIVRDLFNFIFIFSLVYLGFRLILYADDSRAKSTLATLILAALLINFSLFFTKLIIDVSHVFTAAVVESFGEYVSDSEPSISGIFIDLMQLTTLFGFNGTNPGGQQALVAAIESGPMTFAFIVSIVLLIAAFVFAAGAFLLMVRFIALNVFLIFSPVMFLGWIFPGLSNFTSQWWSRFLGYAFFAPAYIFLLYVAARIMVALQSGFGLGQGGNFAQAMNSDVQSSVFAIVPFYILTAGFMIAAVVIAQKMGVAGASATIKVGNNVRGRMQRGLGNAGRFAARSSSGWAARGVATGAERTRQRLDNRLGRMAQGGAWSQRVARTLDRTVGAGLRSAENASIAGSETLAQRRTRVSEQQRRFNTNVEQQNRTRDLDAARQNATAADVTTPAGRQQRQDAVNAIGAQIRRMSNDELLAYVANNGFDSINNRAVASNLTDAQITALRDSGNFTRQQMTDLGDTRNDGVLEEATVALDQTSSSADELNQAFDQLAQTITNMSAERKAGLGFNRLNTERVALNLSDRDIEQLEQSGRFDATQIRQIRATRDTARTNIAGGNLGAFTRGQDDPVVQQFAQDRQRNLLGRNPQDAGRMPVAVFTSPEMRPYLTPELVEQRMRNGVSDTDRDAIRQNIDDHLSDLAATSSPDFNRIHAQWQTWTNRSTYGASLGLTNL